MAGQLPKNLSHGEKPIHLLGGNRTQKIKSIALVEDIISAIKESRHNPVLPLWGSSLSKEWYPYLKGLTDKLIFWLDYDKYPEAIKQSSKARLYGFGTYVIRTDRDPKELTDEEIRSELQKAL